MASRTVFVCRRCDYQTPKWLGRCPECGAWGALDEERSGGDRASTGAARAAVAGPLPYTDLVRTESRRETTGIVEIDRVLGGGLVDGAVILLGGEPGIGKSTLLLQTAAAVAGAERPVLYVTGEESASQLRLRGDRLGVDGEHLMVLAETDVDVIIETARASRFVLVIVDSIQAVRCAETGSVPGTVAQVREAASRLVGFAKASATPVFVVGHVTKDGALAGPRALEHIVDTVLQFEGDRHHSHRILRALKNRFGPSDELGVFTMTERGLAAVANPSELFLSERTDGTPGSAVLAAMEGTRPVLVEIQALVGDPAHGSPRRTALGIEVNRLAMILAVLKGAAELDASARDVFVNVAGGLTVDEPAADLAVAVAAASSAYVRAVPSSLVVMGEIGLTGEIRAVPRIETRLREAARLGFREAIVPHGGAPTPSAESMKLHAVRHLADVIRLLFR
ncbi:MAG: DNA repair protein RadA [Acidobacteriota bacterium]|nr:DNA repair protein RadA [Acidobacteriota bacterium]